MNSRPQPPRRKNKHPLRAGDPRRALLNENHGVRVTMIVRNLGDALKFHRLSKKLTQRQLAMIAGVEASTISKAEAGRHEPNWVTMCLLADALGCKLDDFRTDTSTMRKEEVLL